MRIHCSTVKKNNSEKILISNSFLLLAFLPYLPVLFHRYSSSSVNPQWIPAPLLSDLYTMLWRFSNAPVLTVVILFCYCVCYSIISENGSESGTNKTITRTLILFFFIPYIGIFLFSFTPLFFDRYIIFTSFFITWWLRHRWNILHKKNKVGYAMMFILPLVWPSL